MEYKCFYPGPEGDRTKANEWLCFADDVFEAFNPKLDVALVWQQVLCLALDHESSQIRCEAYDVMKHGVLKHSSSMPCLRQVAEKLQEMRGEELLLALHLIGMSGEKTLAGYLNPFLDHDDPSVRAEALEAQAELCMPGGAPAADS